MNNIKNNEENLKKVKLKGLEPIIVSIVKAKNLFMNETEEENINNLSLSKNDSKIELKNNNNYILEEKRTEKSNISERNHNQNINLINNIEIDSRSNLNINNINNDLIIMRKKGKNLTLKKNLNYLNKIKFDKISALQFNSSDEDTDRVKLDKQSTEKELERVKQILSLNEKELNEFNFKKALKHDKRTFIQIYFSFLKLEHSLIKIFNSKDYNSLIIKIYLFFYNFNLNYAVNALFFNEGTLHQILEEEGKFNFLYQLPQILYSSIISYFLGMILENFALSEDEIINFKDIKVSNIALKKANKIIIILEIKFFHFFLLSFLMLILLWYYVVCFCVVYTNTQYHLIKDTIIGFGTGLLTPLGTKLIPALFRTLGIKKKNKYFFLISEIIQIFL